MENASKALLIAAAVLIVVLLIAFGMNIFNKATEAGDPSATTQQLQQGITQGSTQIQQQVYNALN